MRTVLYTTDDQRKDYVKQAEDAGETMLHDDFDVGPSGEHQLTFDKIPDLPPTADEIRLEELRGKRRERSMTLQDIMEYLDLLEK